MKWILLCQLHAHVETLWRHVCLLIRAATVYEMSGVCLFLQLQIFIYTFIRHSSLQTGVAMLALRIIISRCYATVIVTVWFLGVSGDGENKHNWINARQGVWTKLTTLVYLFTLATKEATLVYSQQHDFNFCLGDEGIIVSPNQGLYIKSFFSSLSLMCKVCDLFYLCVT